MHGAERDRSCADDTGKIPDGNGKECVLSWTVSIAGIALWGVLLFYEMLCDLG